jgi:hypothetical protein
LSLGQSKILLLDHLFIVFIVVYFFNYGHFDPQGGHLTPVDGNSKKVLDKAIFFQTARRFK